IIIIMPSNHSSRSSSSEEDSVSAKLGDTGRTAKRPLSSSSDEEPDGAAGM
ncbi:unnamed protein product, partial [Allacma fusca]